MSRGLDVALLDIEEGFEECFLTSDYSYRSELELVTNKQKEVEEEATTYEVTGNLTLSF